MIDGVFIILLILLLFSVKKKLGSMYGNCAPYLMNNMTIPLLERKIQVFYFLYLSLKRQIFVKTLI